ncbi:hypothetical protein [Streptomyces sp. NPDC054952]
MPDDTVRTLHEHACREARSATRIAHGELVGSIAHLAPERLGRRFAGSLSGAQVSHGTNNSIRR